MDESHKKSFEKIHALGFWGMFRIYGYWRFLMKPSFLVSFSLGFIVFAVTWKSLHDNNQMLSILSNIIEIGIGLNGSLIGLTIAGLALMITFGSEKLIEVTVSDALEKALENKQLVFFSSYQTSMAKFGFAVIIQVLALITLFLINLIFDFHFTVKELQTSLLINAIVIGFSVFLILFSLFVVVQMTINVFTLSQMIHMVYFSEKTNEIIGKPSNQTSDDSSDGKSTK